LAVDPEFDLAWRNLRTISAELPARKNDPLLALPERYQELDRLIRENRFAEALPKVERIVEELPKSFRAHFYKGNVLFSLGRLEDAAKAFEAAVRFRGDSVPTWQNLGVTYDRLSRPKDAEAAYRKVLQYDPEHAAAKARLGASTR
jgi:tetratricopeptide (TPR) repeat protein